MTKLRPPLTFELALTRVAGQIGWAQAAAIASRSERTVRAWSDQDVAGAVTLDAALQMDLAFMAAGGDGTPFLTCYATRLETDAAVQMFSRERTAFLAAIAHKEWGEAAAAICRVLRPGASLADRQISVRELEEAIAAGTALLAHVRTSDEPAGHAGGGDDASGQEVPPSTPTIDSS